MARMQSDPLWRPADPWDLCLAKARQTPHPHPHPLPVLHHGIMAHPLRRAGGRPMVPIQPPITRSVSAARLPCEICEISQNTWTSSLPKPVSTRIWSLPKPGNTRTWSLPEPTTTGKSTGPEAGNLPDRSGPKSATTRTRAGPEPAIPWTKTAQELTAPDAIRPARRFSLLPVSPLLQ
jgi:hypothetical protein